MPNQLYTLDDALSNIRHIIYEIQEKSTEGDYIYRGEPEHYDEPPYHGKISSNLYRQYARIEADEFNIEVVEEEILAEAAGYSHETDDPLEVLTQLQHYGGKTNLIDFTTDYLIAIFFACDNSDSLAKDGRLILLQRTDEWKDLIFRPRNPRHRVIAQKSVFVRHSNGFLRPEDVNIITIPAYLKLPMLAYLQKYHDISTEAIYNDLHGFIINQSFHEDAYREFHRGLTSKLIADASENPEEKQAAYEKAISHYTRALELKPNIPEGYNNRGNAYRDKGEIDKAIEDYNMAIESDPEDAVPYNNRGVAYLNKGEVDQSIADFSKALECDSEDANAYNNLGVAYFDKGEIHRSIKEYSTAIGLKSEFADAYSNRSMAWLLLKEWEKAREDLTIATELEVNIIALFHQTYESIANFEQENDVTLPEEIAAMLAP